MFEENNTRSNKPKRNPLKNIAKKIAVFFVSAGQAIKLVFHKATAAFHISRKNNHNISSSATSETVVFDHVPTNGHRAHAPSARLQETRAVPHISKEHLSGEGKEHINMFRPRRQKNGVFISVLLTSFKLILVGVFMVGAAGVGTIVGVAKAYMETTPTLDTERIEDQAETSYIYDMNGEQITAYTGIENRDWASLDEIPIKLQQAVVAIEDVRFYNHDGVDLKRLLGAFLSNLMNDNVQGGSTITQQLIKNRMLTTERTYKRKIQEAYLAMQLEKEYNKDQILEAYMNTIFLGGSNYGVKAAAQDYFHKSLDQLTLRESAMLAGITQYPYSYDPRRSFYVKKDPKPVNDRTDKVLMQMYKAGYITKEEYEQALKESVFVYDTADVSKMYDYPYFVEYAVYDVITHFLKLRGLQDTKENRADIENEIRTSGYKIYTTVDPKVQIALQDSINNWDDYPELEDESKAIKQSPNADGSVTETVQPQAAAVIVDHKTGQIKALVGGRPTPEVKKTLNRAYQTTMPVGSSIKPIAVYAPAIDKGASDGTIVPNMPVKIEGWDDGGKGYPSGGASKYGPVTLRTALVSSLNSATAFTLLDLVKLDDSYNYLVEMGINPNHIQKTGSGLALGTSGITPVEMAGAFATIANGGVYKEPLAFTEVRDKHNNVILSADDVRVENPVFKESTAFIVADMLVNAVKSGTGTKAKIDGMTIGGKTGTNQDAKGVFFAGISPYYTATLWIGHDDYAPLKSDVYASSSAAPLWKDFMSKILEGMPDAKIIDKTPEELGLVSVEICSVTGKRATEACKADQHHPPQQAYYVQGTQPAEECDAHQLITTCPVTGKIATPYCDQSLGQQSYLYLPADSIYWRFRSDEERNKYMPNLRLTPEIGVPITQLDPSDPSYYQYYCEIHNVAWAQEQTNRSNAINSANAQIGESNNVLSNPIYVMSSEDNTRLTTKIGELQQLIADVTSTSGAIEQKTSELKSLTDRLVALYTPTSTPTSTPTPTEP